MKKFSKSIFVVINNTFKVFLMLTLLCHQLVWTMEDYNNSHSRRSLGDGLLTVSPMLQDGYEEETDDCSSKKLGTSKNETNQNQELSTVCRKNESHIPTDDKNGTALKTEVQEEAFLLMNGFYEDLQRVEESVMRSQLRWANFDNLLQRFGYLVVLRRNDITHEQNACSVPVWLSGGAFPVASKKARQRILFVDGFRQGTEHVLFKAFDVFLAVSIYQIMSQFLDKERPLVCQPDAQSIDWFDLDNKASIGLFHDILNLPYVQYIVPCLPPLWGIMKGAINTRSADILNGDGTQQESQTSFMRYAERMNSDTNLGTSLDKRGLITFVCKDLKLFASLCRDFSKYLHNQLSFEQLDEDINSYGTGNSKFAGFYGNTLRWLGPYHPIDWRLNVMMKNALWNPHVSEIDLQILQNRLELLINIQVGYTPLSALDHAKKIAFGLNIRDQNKFGVQHLGERREAYQDLKKWAFEVLQEKAGKQAKEVTESEICALRWQEKVNKAYARYLLWSLGQSGLCETFSFLLLKTVKLGLQVYSAWEIYKGLYEALSCPKEPGVSISGVEPWARDLTGACFYANVKAFNIIPGQPAETLIGNLGQYHFSSCTIYLDLSNKGLANGTVVAEILKWLQKHNITVKVLNLAGNAINTAADFEVLLPAMKEVKHFNISNNNIGSYGEEGTIALGQSLGNLTKLTALDLSNNNIGSYGEEGTIALGQSLGNLTQLTALDLSNNNIGKFGEEGTIALGQSLGNLTQLTALDLSNNNVGNTGEEGTIALGQSLGNLTQLTALDLSNNIIGGTGESGTVALGQSLGNLTQLTALDLSWNGIGYDDEEGGLIVLAQSLGNLTQLTVLDLSNNNIGSSYRGKGSIALGQSLGNLMQLRVLDLSNNNIGEDGGGTIALGQALGNLTQLTALDLSNNYIGYYDEEETIVLAQSLGNLTQLTALDLSNNDVGEDGGENGTIALGQSLGNLTRLTALDLSNNYIGWYGELGIREIAASLHCLNNFTGLLFFPQQSTLQNITFRYSLLLPYMIKKLYTREQIHSYCAQLPSGTQSINLRSMLDGNPSSSVMLWVVDCLLKFKNITKLDLSHNNIEALDKGSLPLVQSLGKLTKLTTLDLSHNSIGYYGNELTVALGQSLGNLTQLTALDLSNNDIDSYEGEGIAPLGQSLGKLTKLTTLDLSNSGIGYFEVIGQFLGKLTQLTALDLSYNSIGYDEIAIGQSLGNLTQLTSLDLANNNFIGLYGEDGVLYMANSIRNLKKLEVFKMSTPYIGMYGTKAPTALVSALLSLPNLNISALVLTGMTNISWSQAADALQKIRSKEMAEACQASKCFNTDLNDAQPDQTSLEELPTQSTARRLLSLDDNSISIVPQEVCLCTTKIDGTESCVCPEDASSSYGHTTATIGASALTGFVYAALPEAVGDILVSTGRISPANIQKVKMAMNTALVYATGSWMGAGAALLTSKGLQYVGVSEDKARIGGNTVGFLVNAGRNLSPTIAVATAANFAAGRIGLWAEKKIAQKFDKRCVN